MVKYLDNNNICIQKLLQNKSAGKHFYLLHPNPSHTVLGGDCTGESYFSFSVPLNSVAEHCVCWGWFACRSLFHRNVCRMRLIISEISFKDNLLNFLQVSPLLLLLVGQMRAAWGAIRLWVGGYNCIMRLDIHIRLQWRKRHQIKSSEHQPASYNWADESEG